MLVYLNIYIYLSLISIFNLRIENKHKNIFLLLLFFFLLIFLSGKLHVGGDYGSYLNWYNRIDLNWYNRIDFSNYSEFSKITFNLIILLLKFLNLEYFYLHFLSSIIFLLGIYKLAKLTNEKLFFIVILIPFFIFVVGMGYIRQSISMGFLFIAIYYWHKNYNTTFLFFFIFSVFLHVSSLVFIFLVFFKQGENKIFIKLFFLFLIFVPIFITFYLYGTINIFLETIEANYKDIKFSNFSFLKFISHLLPLFLFIFFLKKFQKEKLYILYLFNLYYVVAGILVLLFFKFNYPNSDYILVIIERFLIPFILIEALILIKIYSYIKNTYKFIYKLNVIFYFGLQLYIWLAFAMNSHAWIPYRSIFLEW